MRTSLSALTLLLVANFAHATVFKCIGADGRVTYTNDRSVAGSCSPLNPDQPISTIPPPQRPTAAPARSTPTPATRQSGASTSPGNFPRVSPEAQRARDDSRRQILESELAAEQQALQDARAELNDLESRGFDDSANGARALERLRPFQDAVQLHERNVEAIQGELRRLR